MLKTMTVRTTIAAILIGLSMSAHAVADTARPINVPAGDLVAALESLAKQADIELVYQAEQLRGIHTAGVNGTYEPKEAVTLLLKGTPLAIRTDDATGVMLVAPPTAPKTSSSLSLEGRRTEGEASKSTGDGKKSFWSRFRLAQSGSQVHAQNSSPSKGEGGGEDEKPVQSPQVTELEEITVTGSRLKRSSEGAAPVTIIDAERIDQLGATGLADVLDYLPQQNFSLTENFATSGQRHVQLRGLAMGTTLVLINGRRTVPGAYSVAQGAFDLNTIPVSAVERVEVLSGSASAIYGADAVGGVVNVVLKSAVERPVIDLYYGAAEGGAGEKRGSFAVGGQSDRLRGSIVLDYFKRDYLFGRERDITNDADHRRFGGTDRRVLTANPGNICAVSGNLPGLSTPCAAVPRGSTGAGLQPSDFLATAGQQNLATTSQYSSLVPASERYGLVASGSMDVLVDMTAFAEIVAAERRDTQMSTPPVVSNALVPATNPFNPFGVPLRANFLLTSLERLMASEETWYSAAVGLRGRSSDWDWELSLLGSQSDSHRETRGNVDAARVTAALGATDPAQALNVLQDGPGGSPALLDSLLADPSLSAIANTSDSLQLGGFARRTIFSLPGGEVQFVAGAEWRYEELSTSSPGLSLFVNAEDAQRESSSIYGEIGIPLLSELTNVPLASELSLTLAGRLDHYSDFGSTFNAQFGLEWRPVPELLLRGSYGESYRAPTLYHLWRPPLSQPPTQAIDPRRGNEVVLVTSESGGNPNLIPETADAINAGIVWTPQTALQPRLAASYWRIEQDQRIISGFNIPTVLANESFVPGRVRRADPTPEDVAAGRPGRLLHVDLSQINQGKLDTSGVDLEAGGSLATSLGTMRATITATRVLTYDSQDFLTSPVTDRVGVANTNGTIPKWKAVGSLGWQVAAYTLSGVVRYASSYDDAASTNIRNGLKVGDSTRVDLQLAVDVERASGLGLMRGLMARLGATNIFDEAPHYSANLQSGYDPYLADLRQRFIYVSVSKEF